MGWVNDLKWALHGAIKPSKQPSVNPAKTKKPTSDLNDINPNTRKTAKSPDRVSGGLTNAGLSQDDIDMLMGKKKHIAGSK